jgi:aspartate racemase
VATAEYYRLINDKVREKMGGFASAEMIISSVNFANIEKMVRGKNWELAAQYLVQKAQELEKAGVDFLLLGTNTMHRVRDAIKQSINIPFIDIFETVAAEIKRKNIHTIGILGTYPVMNEDFYKKVFADLRIEAISPDDEDKHSIDMIIFDELTKNIFKQESQQKFIEVINNLVSLGAKGIVLACTEIKLLVDQKDVPKVPLFDTTTLHCEKAAKLCVGDLKIIN